MNDTLYLSDLDGTLLRSDQSLSAYTCAVIDRLVSAGVHFSYATARSIETAEKVTRGIRVALPVIVQNGTFIVDSATKKPLWSAKLTLQEAETIFEAFLRRGLFPIIYAVIDGRNRFSYLRDRCTGPQWEFLLTRIGGSDRRAREIFSEEDALDGDLHYFACISDDEGALLSVKEALEGDFRCIFSHDIYTGAPWLEVMSNSASKAAAARRLREMLGCNKLVCFGDAVNDLPMFELADERYAVANAAPELKAIATDVIDGNDEDAVAGWLEKNNLI